MIAPIVCATKEAFINVPANKGGELAYSLVPEQTRFIRAHRWPLDYVIERFGNHTVIVGTAHVSAKSVQDVEETIRAERPKKVLVELDETRYEALRDPEAWQKTDIIQILKQKRQHVFLLQLYLANMQSRMGAETGVPPGGELLRAIEVAEEVGAEVVLIDRDVTVTLKRGFGSMNFFQRMRLFANVWMEMLTPADDSPKKSIDELLETDAVTQMTEEFARFAPSIKTALIDERDDYMAAAIHEHSQDASVVAVVGAGHVTGIQRLLIANGPDNREQLSIVPKKWFTVGKFLGVALPASILGVFAWLFVNGDTESLKQNLLVWLLVNGTLSALGALLARGHILSILTAFVAAPLTSLSPALAAGWFAGLVEAKVHTPTVGDFSAIKHIEHWKDFWRNGVVRILLVAALANVGSVIGTYIAAFEVFSSLGGGP